MANRKPSLEELERLLNSEDDTPVTINPDGTIQRSPTMLLKNLTALEKRDLVYLAAHRANEKLVNATKSDSVGNFKDDRDIEYSISQYRTDLYRVLDLIEECGITEDL